MTILKKQFTREKWLMHFSMWDQSDRAGFERYAGHAVEHNLFYAPTFQSKVSVYYSDEEFELLAKRIAERLASQPSTWDEIKHHLDRDWVRLFPYLQHEKSLATVEDFIEYFTCLTDWWTAMTIAFFIPDIEAVDSALREEALRYRERSEKYAQISHDVIEDFWRAQSWPETQDLLPVVTPEEAVRVLRGECSPEELERLRARIQGYGMFDRVVYPASELKAAMDLQRVIVEEEESSVGVAQVSGRVAYTGRITARACLVLKKG